MHILHINLLKIINRKLGKFETKFSQRKSAQFKQDDIYLDIFPLNDPRVWLGFHKPEFHLDFGFGKRWGQPNVGGVPAETHAQHEQTNTAPGISILPNTTEPRRAFLRSGVHGYQLGQCLQRPLPQTFLLVLVSPLNFDCCWSPVDPQPPRIRCTSDLSDSSLHPSGTSGRHATNTKVIHYCTPSSSRTEAEQRSIPSTP